MKLIAKKLNGSRMQTTTPVCGQKGNKVCGGFMNISRFATKVKINNQHNRPAVIEQAICINHAENTEVSFVCQHSVFNWQIENLPHLTNCFL